MILNEIEKTEFEKYTSEFNFSPFIKNKTFLITGSSGMTASAIVKWILYENVIHGTNAKIYASTRTPNRRPDFLEENDNVEMCEFANEREVIGDAKIDYIIHAASPTERAFFVNYPAETFSVIVSGTESMLELCREKNASFILLSSVEIYGAPSSEIPIDESNTGAINSLNIRNGYPLGKKGAEFLSYAYFKEYNCDTKIVRISAIQGLYQEYSEQRIFNEITRCILENKNLIMKTDGLSKKSIIYTLDAVSGILAVLFKGEQGETYNITNPETYMPMKELAERMFSKFNLNVKIEYDITPETTTGYLPHLELVQSIEKISELGWRPITDLEQIYEVDIGRWRQRSVQ
jgi:nucleoside-diphosphate-sugar epimerase